jgi:hypothetical protein
MLLFVSKDNGSKYRTGVHPGPLFYQNVNELSALTMNIFLNGTNRLAIGKNLLNNFNETVFLF